MTLPPTKLSLLRDAWDAGDHLGALTIAAKFPRLGDAKEAIERAWAAHQNPTFYRQLGHDPDACMRAGLDALARRYDLAPTHRPG